MNPLIEHGVVQVSAPHLWLHPAVARPGRDLSRRVEVITAHAADHLWTRHYEQFSGEVDGPHQDYLGKVAASCVPYLMRLGRWEEASARSEEAINHDRSPDMAARLLPFLREIVLATAGTPLGRTTRYVRCVVQAVVNPPAALRQLDALYAEAVAAGDVLVSMAVASTIADVTHRAEPLEARAWLQRALQASDAAAVGPWPRLLLRLHEAQVLLQLDAAAEALDATEQVLAEFERLQAGDVPVSGVNPHTLLVTALSTAAGAAYRLGDRARERRYRERALDVAAAHGAAARDLAQLQVNQVQQLVVDGRLDEAQAVLLAARTHFRNPGDEGELGLVLVELADLEHLRGHDGDAVELGRQALRASYAAGEWLDAARSHQRLATFVAGRAESAGEAPVHLLAAAVILWRSAGELVVARRSPQLQKAIGLLRFCLAKNPSAVPGSLEDLSAALQASTGLDLGPFLAASERVPARRDPSGRLMVVARPQSPVEGDSVTDVLTVVNEPPLPAALLDPAEHPEQWREIVEFVASVAPSGGALAVADLCDDLVSAGWGELAAAITAIARGLRVVPDSLGEGTPERHLVGWILDRVRRDP